MKKIKFLAYAGAIALLSTGFNACSDKDEFVAEVNPGYNPETGEVPVNFVFNVSTESNGTTRMSPATVQVSENSFRGIQNAVLLSYKLPEDGKYVTDPATEFDNSFDMNALAGANYLTPQTNETGSSHRILEMSLPVNTNTLMLWGRAVKDPTKNAEQGNITFDPLSNLTKDIADLSFKTQDCLTAEEKLALKDYEDLITTVFNKIVQFSVTSTKVEGKEIKWSNYVHFDNGTLKLNPYDPSSFNSSLDPIENNTKMSPLGRILGNLFITFNTYSTVGGQEELRNGEGAIIAYMMKDLDKVLGSIKSATPTTTEEEVAKEVADGVKNEISKFFDFTGSEPKWKSVAIVKQNAGKDLPRVTKELQGFPHQIFHLPPGSTIMKYIAVDKDNPSTVKNEYIFMSSVPTYAMGSASGSFDPNNYIYPAELCYFGNSPIRVTNEERTESQYPNGATNWSTESNWTEGSWTSTHVLSSTRSVAMKDNINYGTSMLVTTVKLKNSTTTFYDNNDGLHSGEAANEFTSEQIINGITLTGVLIGGQVNEVGWDYVAKGTPSFAYMVYDDQLPSGKIPTTGTPNYTLVWDNWNESSKGADQNKVYVALQFKNETGKDFWGMHNIIRNNATFYLIGELDPNKMPTDFKKPGTSENATQAEFKNNRGWGIDWPTNYALPPYDTDGTGIKQRRVFIQDFKTLANFVIGPNSLKSALVSIPDLRSSQLSLGLSVDLQWRNGLTFDDVILGGE